MKSENALWVIRRFGCCPFECAGICIEEMWKTTRNFSHDIGKTNLTVVEYISGMLSLNHYTRSLDEVGNNSELLNIVRKYYARLKNLDKMIHEFTKKKALIKFNYVNAYENIISLWLYLTSRSCYLNLLSTEHIMIQNLILFTFHRTFSSVELRCLLLFLHVCAYL
jgi:uncharacterized protein YjgD (DUF1641 family)